MRLLFCSIEEENVDCKCSDYSVLVIKKGEAVVECGVESKSWLCKDMSR